ncbi:MAG: PfkB family carbohydrate kinase [Alphaproteobacteria bacterium]|jgi:rfaE bifunctional protein kinase chain/domain/rfaE bifunctional protein nucleotidyltransferase chain/domain|nr:PfkB family carbohydrate kinase [Alphaproteobacteria bacterium]|tara:strand:+ start:8810 stop:10351 length:1542 start_codon:yes stop_codon:yes gene_type:complete
MNTHMNPTENKIKTIEALGDILAEEQAAGRVVAMAVGVFDLFHLGHLRHLQAAKREGDTLFVAVTADTHAGKAPGRPVFSEHMRAEMVAAQEIVDWVVINPHPGAEQIIETLQPDVYVKGSEYTNPEDDITGRIVSERESVEKHGGRTVFTEEVTFSSSNLINRNLRVFDPSLRDYLNDFRQDGGLGRVLNLIEGVRDYRVLVVGDTIIDDYVYATPMGKSPKENIIATRYEEDETFAGGVIAVANALASICGSVDVVTVLGAVGSHRDLVESSIKDNVDLTLLERLSAPTTRKQRFIEPTYVKKMFEVYFMDDSPLPPELETQLNDIITARAADYDLVVVTDFGHGMLRSSTIALLVEKAKFLAVNAQSNSANLGYNLITRYPRADYICIDTYEARLAVGDKFKNVVDIVTNDLSKRIDCDKITVTLGSEGCVTFENGRAHEVPAIAGAPIDTVGAGDAFFAVTAPIVASGAAMKYASFIGNIAGGLKIDIIGHRRSVERVSLVKTAKALLK